MKYKLSDICEYAKGKIKVSALDENTYISTENMLPNKGGITKAASLPTQEQTQAFMKNDVLVSNIRPYFKKIWYATFDGGCSNDVLVFRAKDGVSSRFLHYVLADDTFLIIQWLHQREQRCLVVIKKPLWNTKCLSSYMKTNAKLLVSWR